MSDIPFTLAGTIDTLRARLAHIDEVLATVRPMEIERTELVRTLAVLAPEPVPVPVLVTADRRHDPWAWRETAYLVAMSGLRSSTTRDLILGILRQSKCHQDPQSIAAKSKRTAHPLNDKNVSDFFHRAYLLRQQRGLDPLLERVRVRRVTDNHLVWGYRLLKPSS